MATGDVSYSWISSGSTTASADTAHNLYGGNTSGGLSAYHVDAVFHVQIQASGADFMLLPTDEASANQDGQWFKQDIDVYLDMPAMKRSDASQLSFRNLTAGDNAVARWLIWERRGL
jgi:hypothetical protein